VLLERVLKALGKFDEFGEEIIVKITTKKGSVKYFSSFSG